MVELAPHLTPIVRRIRPSEQGTLEDLCRSDELLQLSLPHYDRWLSTALLDLSKDGRVAYGAFLPIFKYGYLQGYRLEGCIFLKRSEYGVSTEIKNLAIRDRRVAPDRRAVQSDILQRQTIQTALLEKVIRFCEARDVALLEADIPHDWQEEVGVLLRLGFRIVSLRERLQPGHEVYTLQKPIGGTYQGDPFDMLRLGAWLCRALLPCTITKGPIKLSLTAQHAGSFPEDLRIDLVEFEVGHPGTVGRGSAAPRPPLRGQMYICNTVLPSVDSTTVERIAASSDSPIKYLLAPQDSFISEQDSKKFNINIVSPKDARLIAGGSESSLNNCFRTRSDVFGYLTVLEPEAIQTLGNEKRFAYFLVSGRGKAILENYGSEAVVPHYGSDHAHAWDGELTLALYAPCSITGEQGGVLGLARVLSVGEANYDQAHDLFPDVYQALSKEDLLRYGTYSSDARVVVLKCLIMKVLAQPLPIEAIAGSAESKDYMVSELVNKMASGCYLSQSTVEAIFNACDWEASPCHGSDHHEPHNNEASPSMKQEETKNKKPKIKWLRVLAESAKGLPGGSVLLGPLLYIWDKKRQSSAEDDLNQKLEAMIGDRMEVTEDMLSKLLDERLEPADKEKSVSFSAGAKVLTTYINEPDLVGDQGEARISATINSLADVSRHPLGALLAEPLKDELINIYGESQQFTEFKACVLRYDPKFQFDVHSEMSIISFVDGMKGKGRDNLKKILQCLSIKRSDSKILHACLEQLIIGS